MKAIHWTTLLFSGALCLGAHALEGDVPARSKDQITQGSWTEICNGSWPVKDIVRDYNRWNKVKIGIDSRLAAGRSLTDFKTQNITIVASIEALAKNLNANVYVIRDFLYIATELPDGVEISGSHRSAPNAKRDVPPPPAGRDVPPDTKKPDGDKPPANKRQPREKPPAGPNPPAAGEKPLPPLRPLTPGSGLAELPAIFPGLRPDTSTVIGWSHKSMKDAAADGKPIILLVYFAPADPKKMTSEETKLQAKFDKDPKDTLGFFDTLVLEDPDVLSELKGNVNFILIPWNEPADSWPTPYTEAAKREGAALFVLPKDASRPVLVWQQRNPACTAKELIKAVKPLLGKPKPEVAHANTTKKPDAPATPPDKSKNAASKPDKVRDE